MAIIIKANDIISDTIRGAQIEIANLVKRNGWEMTGDEIEAAAAHIVYTDEDWSSDMLHG